MRGRGEELFAILLILASRVLKENDYQLKGLSQTSTCVPETWLKQMFSHVQL